MAEVPDPTTLLERIGMQLPLLGFYDAPDPTPFDPIIQPESGACVFSHYASWVQGVTLELTQDTFGCRGAGRWLCGSQAFGGENFVNFLVDTEGLKDSKELMGESVEQSHFYVQENPYLFIGPFRPECYEYLKTLTFMVNPDQLSILMTGAQYHAHVADPAPVIAPFGSGCSQLVNFPDISVAQSLIGATDMAMRHNLPPDLLFFTVTKPMFERLCSLDERSFLFKGFLKRLQDARLQPG
ncbi:MAG TPA: DUF169 domain-containing protein [Candidatus Lokiarchaeia archaeon]|nr:DUF169 domain-containing protein [Candidatus Lokiarchaeia archaeon]